MFLSARILIVAKVHGDALGNISLEYSDKYESQATGATDVAVRAVRGMFMTLRVGRKIPEHHPLMSCFLEHAALLLNIFVRGADGLTLWARVRGSAFGQSLLDFGESLFAKQPPKGPQHDIECNMAVRQSIGVLAG